MSSQEHDTRINIELDISLKADLQWLHQLNDQIKANMHRSSFSIGELAALMNMPERTFYDKLKIYTNRSPLHYLREIRLLKAYEMLKHPAFQTVSEVAYQVGFHRPEYFTQQFKKRFGQLPSAILTKE
jgi:AraC-like DNA-binding protein